VNVIVLVPVQYWILQLWSTFGAHRNEHGTLYLIQQWLVAFVTFSICDIPHYPHLENVLFDASGYMYIIRWCYVFTYYNIQLLSNVIIFCQWKITGQNEDSFTSRWWQRKAIYILKKTASPSLTTDKELNILIQNIQFFAGSKARVLHFFSCRYYLQKFRETVLQWKLENVAIASHCILRPPGVTPVVLPFNYRPYKTQSRRSSSSCCLCKDDHVVNASINVNVKLYSA